MHNVLKWLFFALVVRPAVLLVLGLNVRHREHLPRAGASDHRGQSQQSSRCPGLMSLLPRATLLRTRPVAAADYFLTNRWLAAFTVGILGIIPIERGGKKSEAEGHRSTGCPCRTVKRRYGVAKS